MAYGIFRVRNLKASQIKGCEQHNMRLYTPETMPENVKTEKTRWNLDWIADDKPNYQEAIKPRLEGVAVRKNSVIAIEFVMGASQEFYKGNYDASGYLSNCVKFVAERYGWDNIVSINQHFDETNPHVHVVLLPISEKKVRWKNQKGEGVKTEKRLCARDITGGPKKLRQLQSDFHEFIVPYGIKAGVEFVRGTLAEKQLVQYTQRTNHRLAAINEALKLGQKELAMKKVKELAQDQAQIQKLEKKVEYRKKMNKGTGWEKGNNFKMGF
jgi:hypothetical protein